MAEVEKPLTDEELRNVRKMLQKQGRKRWLLASIKQLGLWVTAVVIGINHGWQALVKLVRFLSSQDPGD